MSKTNEDPSKAVERILQERNVALIEFIMNRLGPFAAELRKRGLIDRDAERNATLTGVDLFQLAQKLMGACHPLLTFFSKTNFPKFIEAMKTFEGMQPLAEEMEADYERASMSQSTFNIS